MKLQRPQAPIVAAELACAAGFSYEDLLECATPVAYTFDVATRAAKSAPVEAEILTAVRRTGSSHGLDAGDTRRGVVAQRAHTRGLYTELAELLSRCRRVHAEDRGDLGHRVMLGELVKSVSVHAVRTLVRIPDDMGTGACEW
jgi:hypothetical protein